MASPQTLQPVLKMKVDELFLFWLSEPSTQAMLKDYLNKIKNGEEIELIHADFKGTSTLVLTENNNNNIASKINATERLDYGPWCPVQALLQPPCHLRVAAITEREWMQGPCDVSVSTKKVKHPCSSTLFAMQYDPSSVILQTFISRPDYQRWCLLFTYDSKF